MVQNRTGKSSESKQTQEGNEAPITLTLALYSLIPDYDSFEATVRACWQERRPDVPLDVVIWDCYGDEAPDNLDVFVLDVAGMDGLIRKGRLLPLPTSFIRDYGDFLPCIIESCRTHGLLFVVPQMICTDLLFTRKTDEELKDVSTIPDLFRILGDDGLLMDKHSNRGKATLYLQALMDEKQRYMTRFPKMTDRTVSMKAAESVEQMLRMEIDGTEDRPEGDDLYPYAAKFAEGMGRAYIGFTETMSAMGDAPSELDFRLFSMMAGENIPVFYADGAAVNARINPKKLPAALELLNMITGSDLMARVSVHDGKPRYLLPARLSVYDRLAEEFPLYARLKDIASVDRAYVFRIRPDGNEYMDEAAAAIGAQVQ